MLPDLTILYITANQMPERWAEFQLGHLFRAIGKTAMVVVSREKCYFGNNVIHLIDAEPKSYWNIYVQMLRAAEVAKTQYVAMVEDDTLYSAQHFAQFRPKADEVSYNRARWSLFSWDPIYCLRQRVSNCSLIAPRDYLVEALRERTKRWNDRPPPDKITGEVGRPVVDARLRVSQRKMVEWYSTVPIVQLNHQHGTDDFARRQHKKHGQIKAHNIPYWGKAVDIARIYNESFARSSGN